MSKNKDILMNIQYFLYNKSALLFNKSYNYKFLIKLYRWYCEIS